MARNVAGQIVLCGDLVAQTPLHVGGYGEDVDSDLPLARDGAGRWYVPGTSLAGALRAWCTAAFGLDKTQQLWGFQQGEEGFASFVVVEDAPIPDTDSSQPEIRDHVGIDRQWGGAAKMIKYDRAVLPRGTSLPFRLTIDYVASQRSEVLNMVTALAEALRAAQIRFGAAKTRGLGKLRLKEDTLTEHGLNSRDGILALLRGHSGSRVSHLPSGVKHRSQLDITIHWRPIGPMMVKAGEDGLGVDHLPLVSGTEDGLTLVLPGSSIKGALRNQAERILLTLLPDLQLSEDLNPRTRFLKHMEEVPLMEVLFGAAGKSKKKPASQGSQMPAAENTPNKNRLGVGALFVDDCYAQIIFTHDQWRAITQAKVEPTADRSSTSQEFSLRQALRAAELPDATVAFHVAVDRWTGGAAESLLFTVLEPHGIMWEPLTLSLDLDRLRSALGDGGLGNAEDEDLLPPIVCLLLVLRDLGAGRVPLGFAVNRGMGTIKVERIVLQGCVLPPLCEGLEHLELSEGNLSALPQDLRNTLNQSWRRWLDLQRAAMPKEVSSEH